MASDAVRFLAISESNLTKVSNQGFFGRIWRALTGKTGGQRDTSQRNLQMAQKATLKLLQKLGEQNVLQMDAIASLGNMVNYLHFSNTELKKKLAALFLSHEKRLQALESEIRSVKEITYWAQGLKGKRHIRRLQSKALRLVAYAHSAALIGISEWHTGEVEIFKGRLEDVGFEFEEPTTVREFLHELLEEADDDFFDSYVLPLVEPSLKLESGSSLPCHYALAEAHGLRSSFGRYQIVQVAMELARAQGATLSSTVIMQHTLCRYLEERGVDLDTRVEYADLGLELLLGARIYRRMPELLAGIETNGEEQAAELEQPTESLPPPGMILVELPESGGVFVDVEPAAERGYDEALSLLKKRGARLPTTDEMKYLIKHRNELGFKIPGNKGYAEWVYTDLFDYSKPRVVAAMEEALFLLFLNEGEEIGLRKWDDRPMRYGAVIWEQDKACFRGIVDVTRGE